MLAYALDEAAEGATRSIEIVVHADRSFSVVDDGRGTDTRRDTDGTWVVKPVMATRDLRFFDVPDAPLLPDGLPRSGMSVVAALSSWLVHTNVRAEGAWSARYEHGLPVGRPVAVAAGVRTGTGTGTSVHVMPDVALVGGSLDVDRLRAVVAGLGSSATIRLLDERV